MFLHSAELASLLFIGILAVDISEEILPANCDCLDWYGGCHKLRETWTDEETWNYQCDRTNRSDATFIGCMSATLFRESIPVGQNKSVGNLWHSCQADSQRLKYETEAHCSVNGSNHKLGESWREGRFQWLCLETGRWVTGCFYANETHPDVFLKIGETGYNGLVKHVCDRFIDYPGRVQYYAEVRQDVHVKHPTNKGINKNLQESADLTLKEPVCLLTN